MWIFWTLVAVVLSTVALYVSFFAVASARRVVESGVPIPADMKLVIRLLYPVGIVADYGFNVYRGLIEFGELPRWGEWTWSHRVQRHINAGPGTRQFDRALVWAKLANAAWPSHIDLSSLPEHFR